MHKKIDQANFCLQKNVASKPKPAIRHVFTLQRKSHLCIPLLWIFRPQSQFPHSCVCERFIYSHDRSTYFPAAEEADRSWKYVSLSQIYECRSWETEHYNSVLEITVSFLYINGNQTFILDSHRLFICSAGKYTLHCKWRAGENPL